MRAHRLTAALAAVPLLLASATGAAHADNLRNDVASTAGGKALTIQSGKTATVQYSIDNNSAGGGGYQGCDATAASPVTVSIQAPAGVTAQPSSLVFSSCDAWQSVIFSSSAPSPTAGYAITHGVRDDFGNYNTNTADFTLHVTAAAPANTRPSVSISGVTDGGSYAVGSVPNAGCDVTDAEDGPSSFAAALSPVTGPYAEDGIGEQTATCSYTDRGDLTASASATYSIGDPTAPEISYELTPATPDGAEGWYRSDVTLTWTVTETESPSSLQKTGCVDQTITADQEATTYTCSASSAGGSAGETSVSIKRDSTAPVVVSDGVVHGTLGNNGWYTSDVTVGFTATDALSGPSKASQQVVVTEEGETVVASPAFSDGAGNTTPEGAATEKVKIDKTAPTDIAFVGGPSGDFYFGSDPGKPTCLATDHGSGLASCEVTGGGSSVGTHSYLATATDLAGNVATRTLTYEVKAWRTQGFYAPVDLKGVLNTVKAGSTVPLKFEVFADEELTRTSAIKSFTQTRVTCGTGAVEDLIEMTSTGGTSLRYDATAGQFIQNWQTPKQPGTCYVATVTLEDGSKISADFKLK